MPVIIKRPDEWDKMRAAGRLAAEVLRKTGELVKPGVTPNELNRFAHEYALSRGATSAPLGYRATPQDPPFPKSICTSVNHVVCHGIPNDIPLEYGDIINCDVTVKLNGYHGDTSRTFFVGKPSHEVKKLVKRTEQAMLRAIEILKPGICISRIGAAIEDYLKPYKYGIVRELTGHGIGTGFHEEPPVFHYRKSDYSLKLLPGMAFTVEPMVNLGKSDIGLLDDGWTVVTVDGKPSAQFEHTVLITDMGHEILTK